MKKALKSYFGGKESPGVYQTIINHIRPHDLFVEPFGGNFAVSRKMNNNAVKYIGEIDFQVYIKYPFSDDSLQFFNLDYRELIDLFVEDSGFDRKVIYFDPPYPLSSIKSKRAVYTCTLSDQEHIDFLNYANSIRGMYDILISTFPNDMYQDLLVDWHLVEFEGWSRHGKTVEWLFLNYNPTEITALHDTRFYGKDFIDRQRISRSIRNTVRKVLHHPDPVIRNEIIKRIRESS